MPITEDKLLSAVIHRDNQSRYHSMRQDYDIKPLDELFEFIDSEEIISILCQKPVTDLMEAIEEYNNDIAHIVRGMHQRKLVDYETFKFDITKNFGWKPGTYPFIHKLVDFFEARYMRASGMESIFKRRISNEGYLDNHRRRLIRMDKLRATAKSMVSSKEADASQYEERMHNTIKTIEDNTIAGNSVSDKVKYSHYFTTNNYDVERPYTFLDLHFITRIDIEPMDMCYIQNGSPAFNIIQPAVVAYYARPLYKILNGEKRCSSTLMGYSKNRHSYLQNHSLWRPDRKQYSGLSRFY